MSGRTLAQSRQPATQPLTRANTPAAARNRAALCPTCLKSDSDRASAQKRGFGTRAGLAGLVPASALALTSAPAPARGHAFSDLRVTGGAATRNPSGSTSADEIVTAAAVPAPAAPAPAPAAPAPVPAAPAAPDGKCTVITGPSYSPSGTIPVSTSGRAKSATFHFEAHFGNAHGAGQRLGLGLETGFLTGGSIGLYALGVGAIPGALLGGLIGGIAGLFGSDSSAACCEVRQYIRWDRAFHTANGGPPHGGFPSGAAADTWIEDRDLADKRYGHRSGPHSDPISGSDEYTTDGTQDMAKGDRYVGGDAPGGPTSMVGQYQFQLKVVDACHSESEKASSSVITVKW